MKKELAVALAAVFFIFVLAGMAGATVLTFDDIASNTDIIPNGYGGFNWDEFAYGTGYGNGTVSGEYSAFNLDANVAKVEDMEFDFHGAYLTAALNDGLSIQIEGYLGQTLLYDNTIIVYTDSPTWFGHKYSNIDKLVFAPFDGTGGDTQFVMDNFTYTTTTNPEPATMLLLGTGLVGVAGAARRKKKNQA